MNRRALLVSAAATVSVTAGCTSFFGRRSNEGGRTEPARGTPPLTGENEAYAAGFTTGGAWPMEGYDAGRSGYTPSTTPPNNDVGAAWLRTPIDGRRTFLTTPPVTDESQVFVGSGAGENSEDDRQGGFVAAFDGESGEHRWRTTVTAGIVNGVVCTDATVLAVSTVHDTARATLTALSAADGSKRWQVDIPASPIGRPILLAGRLYLSSRDGGVTAVSLDGTRDWTRPVGAAEEYAATAVSASGSSVYVATDRGRVVALAAADGERRWRRQIVTGSHRPRIQTSLTAVEDSLFVTGTDYHLYAVNAVDGTERWATELLEERYGNAIPSVTVVDDTLYVNTIHGGLLALRRDDGTERWRTGKYGASLPPAAAGELIVAPTTGGSVRAYDVDGDHLWQFDMPAFDAGMAAYIMDPDVALAHDRVYIALHDGRLFSLGSQ